MSDEQQPLLWSDERLAAEMRRVRSARQVAKAMRDEYQAKLDAARAERDALVAGEWEVLTGDSTDYSTLNPKVGIWAYHEDGREISISTSQYEIFAQLPPNIRLCRRVARSEGEVTP